MAVATTTDYNETTRTIVNDALTSIGVLEPGEAAEHEQFLYAQRVMNRILKEWMADGYHLWRRTEGEITLVAGKQSYTMGGTGSPDFSVRPLRIESMRFTQSDGTEAPRMISVSREDYFTLPRKDAGGSSTQFYYDPQEGQGVLYVWPVLSAISNPAESIKFTYLRPFFDFDTADNNPDVPQEWLNAIIKVLAADLAMTYYPGNMQMQAGVEARAQGALMKAKDFDREWADVELVLGER